MVLDSAMMTDNTVEGEYGQQILHWNTEEKSWTYAVCRIFMDDYIEKLLRFCSSESTTLSTEALLPLQIVQLLLLPLVTHTLS